MLNRADGKKSALYRTPFSRDYWAQAFSEVKNPRMLVFAALIIALRVVLKSVKIPIAPSVEINTAFIVNAFGAMVYGPVVAMMGAAVSDTLGVLLVPSGPYFFPFIFTEIAGSLIFALFLYRTQVSILRLVLARFCICFFVNILMTEPIMIRYYQLFMTTQYTPFQVVRIVKNMMLFPIEAVVLAVVFRGLIPQFKRLGYLYSGTEHLTMSTKHIALLLALFLAGAAATGAYVVNDYNTKSFSASYTAQERLEKNTEMNHWVAEKYGMDESVLVTIIESARSQVGNPQMTYELAIYIIDEELFAEKAVADPAYTLETLRGYSKSKAARDDVLTRMGDGTAVTDKKTGEHLTLTCQWKDGG